MGSYTYEAVLDTGSPFLTAPPGALSDARVSLGASAEQFGDCLGTVQWRRAAVAVAGRKLPDMVFGVPSANLLVETAGIFCGLMREDDVHPTVLAPRCSTPFARLWTSVNIISRPLSKIASYVTYVSFFIYICHMSHMRHRFDTAQGQLGCDAFVMDYPNRELKLLSGGLGSRGWAF